LEECPLILFKNKSLKNPDLDVAQPMMNLYLEYCFKRLDWEVHPLVIPEAGLKADFRKKHNERVFQIEIQFGNMSRWYSDVFKFQLASIINKTDIGICIVPTQALADKIDSNVVYYERCTRELPHIRNLLHLPILIIGVAPGEKTRVIDLDTFGFEILKKKVDRKSIYSELKKGAYIKQIVQAIYTKSDFSKVNEKTPIVKDISDLEENEDDSFEE
jgi:hypothetical protein